ncbi:hypothetical protein FisN_26Hu138 [Fistulifera solaris]|uniref:Uncharacterized protein n=1 Tax=Fistulifera solaris TaxID=1519565 RepID=A0A1Z5JY76_FISSO|nr:hypothetical protein FisN_26Hu138 [Fistulifera solaris]|eukprot:GAX18836.1 hypothetical protein FisN_26Hu138 [Fistulifera solaris]
MLNYNSERITAKSYLFGFTALHIATKATNLFLNETVAYIVLCRFESLVDPNKEVLSCVSSSRCVDTNSCSISSWFDNRSAQRTKFLETFSTKVAATSNDRPGDGFATSPVEPA